jgi:cell division protein FtsX
MSNDRIAHKSISLREEKCLANEIKNLEKNISKVIYNSTIRAKLQDTVDGNEIRQDQVRVSILYSSFVSTSIFLKKEKSSDDLHSDH